MMEMPADRQEAFRICRDFYKEFGKDIPNDTEIIYLAQELKMLGDSLPNPTFTRGEKQLLRTIGQTVLTDYTMTDLQHKGLDYSAMRIMVELMEKALIDKLDDRNILLIDIDVLFNDVLKCYRVEYDDNSNSGDSLAGIYIDWNAQSELYNSFSAYKVSYQGFDKHSISSLASATEKYKEYQNRTDEEKEILSVNGIAADYAAVVEHEFKKIVKLLINVVDITFYDAINEYAKLSKYDSPALRSLADSDNISNLHFIRKIHNDIDHGKRLIQEEELDKLYHVVIEFSLCQLLSDAYVDLSENQPIQ